MRKPKRASGRPSNKMTNAPDSRQTHVVRIVGTNKDGDVLQDIWADVERIDFAKSASQTAEGFDGLL